MTISFTVFIVIDMLVIGFSLLFLTLGICYRSRVCILSSIPLIASCLILVGFLLSNVTSVDTLNIDSISYVQRHIDKYSESGSNNMMYYVDDSNYKRFDYVFSGDKTLYVEYRINVKQQLYPFNIYISKKENQRVLILNRDEYGFRNTAVEKIPIALVFNNDIKVLHESGVLEILDVTVLQQLSEMYTDNKLLYNAYINKTAKNSIEENSGEDLNITDALEKEYSDKIDVLTGQIEELQRQLNEKDARIIELNNSIEQANQKLENTSEQLVKTENILKDTREELDEQKSKVFKSRLESINFNMVIITIIILSVTCVLLYSIVKVVNWKLEKDKRVYQTELKIKEKMAVDPLKMFEDIKAETLEEKYKDNE